MADTPSTDERFVTEFKRRWDEADQQGLAGSRVATALLPILVEVRGEATRAASAEAEAELAKWRDAAVARAEAAEANAEAWHTRHTEDMRRIVPERDALAAALRDWQSEIYEDRDGDLNIADKIEGVLASAQSAVLAERDARIRHKAFPDAALELRMMPCYGTSVESMEFDTEGWNGTARSMVLDAFTEFVNADARASRPRTDDARETEGE